MGLHCCKDAEPPNNNLTNRKQIVTAGGFFTGKSTFFKSLTILFGNYYEYSADDFEKDLQNVSVNFLLDFWLILCDLEERQFDDLKQSFKTEFEIINHKEDNRLLQSHFHKKDCKQLFLKFWNQYRLEEFYELLLIKKEEIIISDNLTQLVNLMELGKKDFNPNNWIHRSRFPSQRYFNSNYEFTDVGSAESKRMWRLFIFPNTVLYFASLSEFNKLCYEDDSTLRINESFFDMEEIFERSERKVSRCKKIIIFTKPDLLIWKLRRGIKYERELNYEIRPELEKIENQNVKLIVNSIVKEYLTKSAKFNIHSYHIIKTVSDSDILHVRDAIFREDGDNQNIPFISSCLLPIKISSQLSKYCQLGLLTDISILTSTD